MSDTGQVADAYDGAFFSNQVQGSIRSAAVIVPTVLRLLPGTRSILDVGCGTGAWLSLFSRHGSPDIVGIDGYDPGESLRQIPPGKFHLVDLNKPFRLGRRFDLAMSLEVAEHLTPERGVGLVEDLCAASDVVLFSAALPGQGGTMHIHEQWQGYWARLFEARDYELFDVVRPLIWADSRVEWWYAQNVLLFVRRERIGEYPSLKDAARVPNSMLNFVHPSNWRWRVESDEEFRVSTPLLRQRLLEAEKLNEETAQVRAEWERAEEERNRAQRAEWELRHSTSWYATAPLRYVARRSRVFRGFVRGLRLTVGRAFRAVGLRKGGS